ncbi:MAG: FtsX-like permease family protein [Vicinamibacterales bacterium]|nr:FtsX-like permease family protein [Vicinamibacterales bacterium]
MEHLGVLVTLAFRNLRRQLRRTILTASAMVIGGGTLMFSLSLGDGTHEEWIDSGVRMGSGHVAIEHPRFRSGRKLEDRLPAAARDAVEAVLRSPAVAAQVTTASAKLTVTGMASSAAGARPARIMAVDPGAEAAFGTIDDQTVEGRYLEPDDRLAAYVGVTLAEALGLRLDSRLVLTAQDAQKEIAGQLVRVVGIYRSGVPEIDQSLIHMPLATAGEWLGSGEDVTNIGVLVADSAAVSGLVRTLRAELRDPIAEGEAAVIGWREAMPELAAAVAIDDFGNYLVYGILFVIIGFGIVNTVLMSVMHRHREFGVLQALGLTPGQTGAVVLFEGLSLTAVSAVIGIALGAFLTWYFFGDGLDFSGMMGEEMTFSGVVIDPVIIPLFRPSRFAQSITFILFIGTVASIYPAIRAARIDVTESMKFDR